MAFKSGKCPVWHGVLLRHMGRNSSAQREFPPDGTPDGLFRSRFSKLLVIRFLVDGAYPNFVRGQRKDGHRFVGLRSDLTCFL